jgi:superfamily I DNA/RNA helicase
MFQPSDYQKAVFEAIARGHVGERDLVVEALAGSGKTTTIQWAINGLEGVVESIPSGKQVLVAAFNKTIATELGRKIPGRHVMTINSLGHRALTRHWGGVRPNLDGRKYRHIARDVMKVQFNREPFSLGLRGHGAKQWMQLTPDGRDLQSLITDLVNFSRRTMTDYQDQSALFQMANHFGLDELDHFDAAWLAVEECIKIGAAQAKDEYLIDFDDQIFLPLYFKIPLPKFDWVFVDEAQDLSASKLALLMASREPGRGRMVFIGDRQQAIYGFSGADNKSVENIIEKTSAETLPLNVCYRCPTSVISMAKAIVPKIEARENAPTGKVEHINPLALISIAQPGDLVLCRLTAPLVSNCIDFIKAGKRARVQGADIGRALASYVDKIIEMESYQEFKEDFLPTLTLWLNQKIAMMKKAGASEESITTFYDKADAIRAVYEGFSPLVGPDTLKNRIIDLFDDDKPGVVFSTVHRAKGMESERVIIVAPEKMPLPLGGWAQTQENNLLYVALTRTRDKLMIAGSKFGISLPAFEAKIQPAPGMRTGEQKQPIETPEATEQTQIDIVAIGEAWEAFYNLASEAIVFSDVECPAHLALLKMRAQFSNMTQALTVKNNGNAPKPETKPATFRGIAARENRPRFTSGIKHK